MVHCTLIQILTFIFIFYFQFYFHFVVGLKHLILYMAIHNFSWYQAFWNKIRFINIWPHWPFLLYRIWIKVLLSLHIDTGEAFTKVMLLWSTQTPSRETTLQWQYMSSVYCVSKILYKHDLIIELLFLSTRWRWHVHWAVLKDNIKVEVVRMCLIMSDWTLTLKCVCQGERQKSKLKVHIEGHLKRNEPKG